MTGTPERWIIIPRWEEFQHRDAARVQVPTWIKLFTRLLSDEAYLNLTGHRRAILHGLWLEYARSTRQLTDNTASLSRRLALKVTSRDLEALNHAGWIAFHASKHAGRLAGTDAGIEERREEKNREVQDQELGLPYLEGKAATNGRQNGLSTIKDQILQSLEEAKPT